VHTEVRKNAEASRYEILLESEVVGVADYRAEGETVVFPHTEITRHLRGQGLGAELVRAALDDVRGAGNHVIARCWYVAEFIDAHPEYQDLLAA
jgi:predicted GNAT family acetyltransferase